MATDENTRRVFRPPLRTGGEDHVLGDELVVHDGELRQLYPVHTGHGAVSASPVKFDIVCGVAV